MPKIGSLEYPALTLSEASEIAEKVGHEGVKTKQGLVEVMGLKNPNGYFYHKVSSMTKYYGLLERGLDIVRLTSTGERIAHPLSAEDKRKALAEAAERVPLFHALFDSLGANYHDADFRTKLRDLTQAPLQAIQIVSAAVERLYRDAASYMSASGIVPPASTPSTGNDVTSGGPLARVSSRDGGDVHHAHEAGFRIFEGDGVFLKVRKDPEALGEALATITAWVSLHQTTKKGEASGPGSDNH